MANKLSFEEGNLKRLKVLNKLGAKQVKHRKIISERTLSEYTEAIIGAVKEHSNCYAEDDCGICDDRGFTTFECVLVWKENKESV